MIIENDKITKMFEFIYERQMVYHKKSVLKEPAPWTLDPIISKYNFCNVYREQDKGTKYIIDIMDILHDEQSLFFNIVIYRIFNIVGLFENVFDGLQNPRDFNFTEKEKLLDEAVKRQSIFNTAYIVTQMSFPHKDYRRGTKHPQFLMTLEWLADQIVNHDFMGKFKTDTPENTMLKLQTIPLVGPFLAGQLMVDMSYTDLVPWGGNDFCIIGPGAAIGINILLDKELKYNEMVDFCKHIWENQSYYFKKLYLDTSKNWKEIANLNSKNGYPYFSVMDIQHIFCEFRKYEHWSSGKGKRKYYQFK